METRFRDLLSEAAQIAAEYRADFGTQLKPPPAITAFRYKSPSRSKAKRSTGRGESPSKAAREVSRPQSTTTKTNSKITGLQKQLATAKKKLDEAKAAGKPTKSFEDRIYEIEDELRLSGHASA